MQRWKFTSYDDCGFVPRGRKIVAHGGVSQNNVTAFFIEDEIQFYLMKILPNKIP
jgi:hypothetical protein